MCVFTLMPVDRDGTGSQEEYLDMLPYRSTNTKRKTYRGNIENSDKSFSICVEGKSDTVNVFESPIDLMSYLTILKIYGSTDFNNHYISLGCIADLALERY
ncbi:hypothetical protein [Wukongibacter sp. M2B1]|uniref:hypothetical protein n=1 Tax=Wukongibacter sp. M2B1 TaxID=3088895 RepID=UPI003D7BD651